MGIRGFIGFAVGGSEKLTSNYYASYPKGLGLRMVTWLSTTDLRHAQAQAQALRVVPFGSVPPSPAWNRALRRMEGNPKVMLELGTVEDGGHLPYDPVFCEWGYMVDFDNWRFEVYRGLQKQPHSTGRFPADPFGGAYHQARMVAQWSLHLLPEKEVFLHACEEA